MAGNKKARTMASFLEHLWWQMAERTGLEPATSGVTGQHSNRLNYRSALYNQPTASTH
jgi:hypothetical protein